VKTIFAKTESTIPDRKYYPRTKVLQTDEIIKEVKIFLSDMSWKPSTRSTVLVR